MIYREALFAKTIAIVAPAIAREGITKQVANQIIGLKEAGFRVCLVVLASSDITILKEYGVDESSIIILHLHQTDPYLSQKSFVYTFRIAGSILSFLKQQQVNVVVAHSPYAHFVLRVCKLFSKFYNIKFKLITYFHGLQYSEYPVNTWKRRCINNLNRWLATYTDNAHISVSGAVKEEISAHLIRHPHHTVIYNSLPAGNVLTINELDRWAPVQALLQQLNDKYIILLPNRIDKNKGQLFFLDVISGFISTGAVSMQNIAVLIVGDGPGKKLVEKKVQELHLQNTVILTGAMPNAAVQQLMQYVNLVAIPSFIEGLSFSALEALKNNKIVLASDTGGISEVIIDGVNGYTFSSGNIKSCIDKLTYIYQNKNSLSIDFTAVQRDLENRFSLTGNTNRLIKLLTEL